MIKGRAEQPISGQPSRVRWRAIALISLGAIAAPWLSAVVLPAARLPPAQAQALRPEVRYPFLADPLTDDPLDPLLPNPPIPRPLSPLELYALEQDLDRLAQEADSLNRAGDVEPALALWMREVRLRRLLGVEPELAAINRVALAIRDRSPTQELQLLSARLDVIRSLGDPAQPVDLPRLETLARLYTTLGDVKAATEIRRSLADAALVQGQGVEYQAQLEQLARLYADWFDFDQAAATYGELVQLAQVNQAQAEERRYLQGQIAALEQAQRWPAALTAQQQLLTLYSDDETLWPQVAELQHQIAQNYRALGDLEAASRQYQVAYSNAIASQQFNVAADAIRALASLYRELGSWPNVRYLYQQLLLVEREAINAYGLMDTFDQLAQLYEQAGDPEQALMAYREGLILARHLGHRQAYFEQQVSRLAG